MLVPTVTPNFFLIPFLQEKVVVVVEKEEVALVAMPASVLHWRAVCLQQRKQQACIALECTRIARFSAVAAAIFLPLRAKIT